MLCLHFIKREYSWLQLSCAAVVRALLAADTMHYTRYMKLKINVTHLSPECRGAVTPRGGAGRHRGGNMRGAQAAHFIIFRGLGAVLMYVLTRKLMEKNRRKVCGVWNGWTRPSLAFK